MDAPPIKLADLLRHPEDLDKISTLKQEFTRKKNAVDSQLRGGLGEQLESTQAGMNGLSDGQKTVQAIKDEMMKIDMLCSESQNMIKDFASINLVSQAHRNFVAVEAMRKNLELFNQRLGRVEEMLREDDEDKETMPHLLTVHYELTQLRNIRDDAIEQIQRSDDPGLLITLEEYFSKLDDAIDWFDEHIGAIAISLISLIQAGNNSLVVRLAVIVEAEEKSDQRVEALQEALKDHKEMATRFQSITDGAKQVRGYKDKFLKAISLNCTEHFRMIRGDFMSNPNAFGKLVRWFFNDLSAVQQGLVPLMPRKWNIFRRYAEIYHQAMHDFLVEIIDDPEATSANTLAIINWPESYYRKMKKMGFHEAELEPHVVDNREQELVKGFRELIVGFLDEWIDRIMAQERRDFAQRMLDTAENSNLDNDEFGYLRTKNLVDMWRMLREQVDAAGNSARADVAEGVIDAMFLRLRGRQQSVQKMLEDEAARYEASKLPDDGYQQLQDWLVATANDQIACIDDNDEEGQYSYLTSFRRKFEPLVSPQYMERTAENELQVLRDGYLDFSTWCMTKFATMVIAIDFKTAMPIFFTAQWYQAATMRQLITTFEDYLADYSQVLHHSLVDVFTEIFAAELLVAWLMSVRNRGARFRRADPFEGKIFDDIRTAFDFFNALPRPDVGRSITQTWRVTELFLGLLTAERDRVPDAFATFKRLYWDLHIGWVEAVLRARDDFERSMLNAVKARAAQMDVMRGPETIMAKVK